MFNADDHHVIGSMHVETGKPCQDYALSGVVKDVAYAIVSDGCSSGGLTDVGSRLITLATASAIKKLVNENVPLLAEDIADEQKVALYQLRKQLSLTTSDLLATCLYVCLTPTGGFVSVRGDGAVAFKWIDGSITLHLFTWPNNTPFYPAYGLDGITPFVNAHGGNILENVFEEEVWVFNPESGFSLSRTNYHSISQGIYGIVLPIDHVQPLDVVAIFTDGVSLVEHVEDRDVVKDLLAFKTLHGAFAKRRMIRFIQESRKNGKGPRDDLGFAAIHVTHEEGVTW